MKRLVLNVGVMLIFVVGLSFAEDSPLVKAAKREKERRAKVKSEKTFTNKDIEDFKAKNKDSEPDAQGENQADQVNGTQGEQTEAQPADQDQTTEPESDSAKDEQYWRDKYAEIAQNMKESEEKVQRLQEEMNGLRIAYYAEQDGVAGRPKINSEIEKQFDEIEAAKKELEESKQALENLEEDARKAGVPPGWVRE